MCTLYTVPRVRIPPSPPRKLSFGVTRVPRFSAESNTRMERSNPRWVRGRDTGMEFSFYGHVRYSLGVPQRIKVLFTYGRLSIIVQINCIMRTNIYKEKILNLLEKRHLMTIAEIHRAIPDADYSTIFRNVEQLLGDKEVKRVVIDSRSVAYESSKDGHDHFICNDCGSVEPIHVPRALIKGRRIDDITLRGSCDVCAK
jgi:Fe2+ or Zn2+ uptake regulation protein